MDVLFCNITEGREQEIPLDSEKLDCVRQLQMLLSQNNNIEEKISADNNKATQNIRTMYWCHVPNIKGHQDTFLEHFIHSASVTEDG